jgi:preprotein translocase subunit SecA
MAMNFGGMLTKVFGSRNDRLIKRYRRIVTGINAWEPKAQALTDTQLRERAQELRTLIMGGKTTLEENLSEAMSIIRESMDRNIGMRNVFNPENDFDPEKFPESDNVAFNKFADIEDAIIAGADWKTVQIPNEVYDAVRRLYPESRPPFRARCFDVQLIGGLVLYEGKIAEMKTGEGKTFVAPLACFLKVIEGHHAHVITVNDYLVKRDSTWTMPAFEALGFTVGYLQSTIEPWGPGAEIRRKAYGCNITYGTNSEFGFDYLRDNMKASLQEQVQGSLDYAIVDEVDSVLIDEARTPLIISGEAHDNTPRYRAADEVARKVLELHKPASVIEKEILAAKREIKAAEGEIDKANGKEERAAAQAKVEEARKKLAAAEERKSGVTFYYEVEYDRKSIRPTHEGIAAAQDIAGVGSFYVGDNVDWPHLLEQALRAHVVYEKDKDYVVEMNPKTRQMEVVIVDEYTGRKMTGRQWSDGLHQAVEAKEKVTIKKETQTMATVTLQNFFKLYNSISGMTGTAQTEAEEFAKIYKLEVVSIPTNRAVVRIDYDDKVYRTEGEKWESIIEEIKAYSDAGRPVLVGTTSVEKSERLSMLLNRKYGVQHEVLNAKQHEREASIVAVAGQQHKNVRGEVVGNVTIATNMAGRGTDIKLAPDTQWDVAGSRADGKETVFTLKQRGSGKELEVRSDSPLAAVFQLDSRSKSAGGLHVIATERHTSRRIDNQLRGRSGRQGDPGSSRFYCSLEDDLLKLFMPEWTVNVFKKIGMAYGEAIESGMLSRSIERAQKKVEERNYLARKNLLEYDEVMDVQRNEFYGMRQRVLEGRDIARVIWKMIGESIEDAVNKYVVDDYVSACIADWAKNELEIQFEPSTFKGIRRLNDLEEVIKNIAKNEIVTTVPNTLGEYLGEDRTDSSQWHAKDLVHWARLKFGVIFTESQLRQMDAGEVEEKLIEGGISQIQRYDMSGLERYIQPGFAARELCDWAEEKFNIEVDPEELILDAVRNQMKPKDEIIDIITRRAHEEYTRREIEVPVDYMILFAFGEMTPYGVTYNAETVDTNVPERCASLAAHVKANYGVDVPVSELQGQPISAIRTRLIELQKQSATAEWAGKEADKLLEGNPGGTELASRWRTRFMRNVDPKFFEPVPLRVRKGQTGWEEPETDTRKIVIERVKGVIREGLTSIEQRNLVGIFDEAWKDHLYAMDMLKGGIGLQAFAEKDPRIAYKREGFRYFNQMMQRIRDRITKQIFKLDVGVEPKKPKSNYNTTQEKFEVSDSYDVAENVRETAATVASNPTTDEQAMGQGDTAGATATIVRSLPKLGRNDTCPKGSGEKYKRCCGKYREDGVCDGSGMK